MAAARAPPRDHPGPAPLGLGVASALLAGVLLVQRFPALPPVVASAVAAAVGAWLWSRPDARRFAGAALFGIAIACLHGAAALAVRVPHGLVGEPLALDVRVVGLPVTEPDGAHFEARIESAPGAAAVLAGRRIRIGWYGRGDAPVPRVASGERWRLVLRLRRPHGLVNPGGFDFERRALERRLAATAYVVDADAARRLPREAGAVSVVGRVDAWRERFSRAIGAAVAPERARFVAALALGDTRALSDGDWAVLRATGLTHLIAISGFHVGIVAGFGALLGRGLWRVAPALGRRWPRPLGAAIVALAFAGAYTALAGFALPTVRTLLMIAAALAARLARRAGKPGEAFAFALVGVLVIDPLSVLAPGFWLSFAGVAWLLWCLPGSEGQGVLLPFLRAQWVAVLGLLPLTVWFFGQASLAGPAANLVGIPWISLGVVPLCLLGLAATPLPDVVSGTLWNMAAIAMEWLWAVLERIAAWPGSLAWLPEPTLPVLALAVAGTLWCLSPRGVPGRAIAACLLLPLLAPAPQRPPPGEADLWLFDAGQGTSLLVRTAHHDLLYDAGPARPGGADLGASTIVPALHALSVGRLDAMMLSHGDADHAGGAAAVRAAMRPRRESAPPGWAREPMRPCLAGMSWRHDGVGFTVLHPPEFFPYRRNDSSCVLRIDAAGASALLPGDIGRHIEARLAKLPPAAIRTDVLLVPHHGSESSSSLDFLAATRPRIALMSVGRDNRFGLPDAIVLGRYDRYQVALHDTAGSGAIHVRLGAGGARVVERLRHDRPRYWRDPPPAGAGYADAVSGTDR